MATMDRFSSAAEKAGESITEAGRQAVETLGETGEQLMSMEAHFMERCRDYVRDYPIASISMAMAAGYLLSQMTHTCEARKH